MRVVGQIPHPACYITIFAWNNRYLIKVETDMLEQTYKIDELDISSEEDLYKLIDETFIKSCIEQFRVMENILHQSMDRLA